MGTSVAVVHEVDTSPTGYPDLDPAYAHSFRATDELLVEYDAEPNDDGSEITVRRTVWTRGRRQQDRKIVWQATAMVLPRGTAPDMVKQIVACLVA